MNELRLAARRLWKSPGFTLAAVLTLAIGIGANAALFTAVRAVLLRPLPFRDPGQLVLIWQRDAARNLPIVEVSHGEYEDWRRSARSFVDLAAMGSVSWDMWFEERGEPARLPVTAVSASFFEVLGAQAAHGRTFRPDEDAANSPRTVVLSHGLWQRRFGGSSEVVGSRITLDGERFTVTGIMSPEFDFPAGTQVWTPLVPMLAPHEAKWPGTLRNLRVLYVLGRLKEDVTADQATSELDAVVRRLAPEWQGAARGPVVSLTSVPDHIFGPTRPALMLLSGTVLVVLFVACANVAGLVLTRASARSSQNAVKRALGATRGRLLGESLAETSLLALVAGAMSLGVAFGCVRIVRSIAPAGVPRLADMQLDSRLVVSVFVLSGVCAFACALPGFFRRSSASLIQALATGSRSSEGRRVRRTRELLIAAEVAAALVLLVGAGLMVRSFIAIRSLDLGFRPANVITAEVDPRVGSHEEWRRAFTMILERVRAIPGVEAAGSVFLPPLASGPIGLETGILLEGQTPEQWRDNPLLNYQTVTQGYFAVMGIELHRGRYFSHTDTASSPGVVVVSRRTADRLWPGENPIGRRVSIGATKDTPRDPDVWQTVIGVVADVRYRALDDVRLDVYMSGAQSLHRAPHVVVRTNGDPVAAAAAIRAAIREAAPRAVVEGVRTMDAIVDDAMAPWRFSMALFVALGAMAAGLASVGVFAVVALSVSQRTREIAVRLAVGATPVQVVRMVIAQAGRFVAAGALAGGAAALALVPLMQRLLYEVEPADATSIAAAVLLLFLATSMASYLAARKATAIDPLRALNSE